MSSRKRVGRRLQVGLAAGLMALAPLAHAASASVAISNVTVQVIDLQPGDDVWPWAVFFTEADWVAKTTSALAHVELPDVSSAQQGWLGTVQSAQASSGGSFALAATSAGDLWSTGPGASASVSVVGDQLGWASATVFNGLFLAGAQTRIVVTASVDTLSATGSDAQANASIELCDSDGTCHPAGYSEALVFGFPASGYAPATTLRAEWDFSADGWGTMNAGVSASAVSAVPEPSSAVLLLAGLTAGVLACGGLHARRRQR
ncbi:PEP-CTERM sorting domain-containing protein [Aquabacterium sp.]|uniref:PEP-CTERM sorting domain-containing protein n=1 Tax=Aquabacterium sp. TaxID=1872578 RepID=UPI002C15F535|nr:PEP-CTERM sorting domain-containing protein [Aquabacterium sp.]HSW08164.1 PEP-CTERM sorting domain-containing protein [Aquabacterium sp.]